MLYYLISKNIEFFSDSFEDFKIDYEWDMEEIEMKKELMYDTFPLVDPETVESFINGEQTL